MKQVKSNNSLILSLFSIKSIDFENVQKKLSQNRTAHVFNTLGHVCPTFLIAMVIIKRIMVFTFELG